MTDQVQAAREIVQGLGARMKRTAPDFTDAQAHLQYREAESVEVILADHARLVGEVEAKETALALAGHTLMKLDATNNALGDRALNAEAKLSTLEGEHRLLQDVLDSRPAINAGLPDSYIRWSRAIYSGDAVRAALDRTVPAEEGEKAAVKRTMTLSLTDEEMAALEKLASEQALKLPTVFRQALRVYQLYSLPEGHPERIERAARYGADRLSAPPAVPTQDVAGVEAGDLEALAELRFGVSLMPQKLVSVNGRIITVAQLDRILAALSAASPSQGVESVPEPKWEWWASADEENFNFGPEDSREAIIDLGRNDFDGEGFFIVEAVKDSSARLFPSAERFIAKTLEEAADDGEFGEDGDFELTGPKADQSAAIAELDVAFKGWLARWKGLLPTPWKFAKTRNAEAIPAVDVAPEDDEPASQGEAG